MKSKVWHTATISITLKCKQTMKNSTIIFLLLLIFSYLFSQSTTDYSQYSFFCRWININTPSVLTETYAIPLRKHFTLGEYQPDPMPTCVGCQFQSFLLETTLQSSADTWNAVGVYPQFSIGGYSDDPLVMADGVNNIGFSDNDAIIPQNSSILAIAKVHLSLLAYNCENNPLRPFVPPSQGFDIVFNRKALFDVLDGYGETNFDYPYYDFETVLTHELGHALGLDHHPSVSSIDVMNGAIPNATKRRNLSAKDEAALKALYPIVVNEGVSTPINPPCEIFRPKGGNDAGTQNSGGGGNTGSGGSICHYIPPTTFSTAATREMILFWENNLGYNFNVLMRRFVQNTNELNTIFYSADARFYPAQVALQHAIETNRTLIESAFALNIPAEVSTYNTDAICELVQELLLLFDTVDFNKEALFREELTKLQKGLDIFVGKNIQTGLLMYDTIANFDNRQAYTCLRKRANSNYTLQNATFELIRISNMWVIHGTLPDKASLYYEVYDVTGVLVTKTPAVYFTGYQHYTTIEYNVLRNGLYIIVPYINNSPQRGSSIKIMHVQ